MSCTGSFIEILIHAPTGQPEFAIYSTTTTQNYSFLLKGINIVYLHIVNQRSILIV